MICPNCGKSLEDEKNFCPSCGTPLTGNAENPTDSTEQSTVTTQADQPKTGKKKAVASLIWGVIALLSCGALIFPEILGITSAKKGKKNGKMRKAAKIGLVCSILSIILLVTGTVVGVLVLSNDSLDNGSVDDSTNSEERTSQTESNTVLDGDTKRTAKDDDMRVIFFAKHYSTLFEVSQSEKINKNPANYFEEVSCKIKKKQIKEDLLNNSDCILTYIPASYDDNRDQLSIEEFKIIDASEERHGFLNTQKCQYITALVTIQLPNAKYSEPVDLTYVYSHRKWHFYDISTNYGVFFDFTFPSREDIIDLCTEDISEFEQLWDIAAEFNLSTGAGIIYVLCTDDSAHSLSDPIYQDSMIKVHACSIVLDSKDWNIGELYDHGELVTVASRYTSELIYGLSLGGHRVGESLSGRRISVLVDESTDIASNLDNCGVCSVSAYFYPETYEEVIVVSCKDPSNCENVKEILSSHAELRMKLAQDEGNEYAKNLDEALIEVKDNHVIMCISKDNQPATEIIESFDSKYSFRSAMSGLELNIFPILP